MLPLASGAPLSSLVLQPVLVPSLPFFSVLLQQDEPPEPAHVVPERKPVHRPSLISFPRIFYVGQLFLCCTEDLVTYPRRGT